MISTKNIQIALVREGFNPGKIDGINGPRTEAAILAFNAKYGLPPTIRLTESGLKILGFVDSEPLRTPWINEVNRYMGVHEIRDRKKLIQWLRSGGGFVGDPAKIPWCADMVETAIKLTLPNEPFPGKVGINPYYSLNWLDFGIRTEPCYGAIAIFVRPGGGHIAFLVGIDPVRKRYRIRGGNQSNAVNDTWIDISRCKGLRWPTTYRGPQSSLPVMNSSGAIISKNEV